MADLVNMFEDLLRIRGLLLCFAASSPYLLYPVFLCPELVLGKGPKWNVGFIFGNLQ